MERGNNPGLAAGRTLAWSLLLAFSLNGFVWPFGEILAARPCRSEV